MDPITIPAIAPPDSPLRPEEGVAAFVVLEDGVAEEVELAVGAGIEKVMSFVMVGNTTFAHLSSAPEL